MMERRKFITQSAAYTALTLTGMSLCNNKLLAAASLYPGGNTFIPGNACTGRNPAAYKNVSTTILLRGKPVKVHGLCTGTVAVKTKFRTKKGFGDLAKLNILLDKHYTPWLPIWVWVIEHPAGLVLVDTGEITAINNLDIYLAKESSFNRYTFKHAAKFNITAQDQLDLQFEKLGLKLKDVTLVALTHLHLDHTDGIQFFPKTEIIVNEQEYNHPNTNMPSTYPTWFNPNKIKYQANQIDIFDKAYAITNDLFYVPTPGHTNGHSSVIFKTDDFDIIFAGDTSYNQRQVIDGELAGVNADFKTSLETYRHLLTYANAHKSIYLPTHDENAGVRLENKTFLV